MPQECSVPGCRVRGGHLFPSNEELCKKWLAVINRKTLSGEPWYPGGYDLVCKEHFLPSDFKEKIWNAKSVQGKQKIRHYLKSDAIPSLFECRKRSLSSAVGTTSQPNKVLKTIPDPPYTPTVPSSTFKQEPVDFVDTNGVNVDDISASADITDDKQNKLKSDESEIEYVMNGNCLIMRILNFGHNDAALKYYTGFESFSQLETFFTCLGRVSANLKFKSVILSPREELILTMMKLRQAKDYTELSILFEVTEDIVSKIIKTWLNLLYYKLPEINMWISQKSILHHMPFQFKEKKHMFNDDESENKPPNGHHDVANYTNNAVMNVKAVVGVTSAGLITFVCDSFGASRSDRKIIDQFEFLQEGEKFKSDDGTVLQHAILLQGLFDDCNMKIKIPTTNHRNINGHKVDSKRLQVEKVVQHLKNYKILGQPLNYQILPLTSRIVFVCCMFVNYHLCTDEQ